MKLHAQDYDWEDDEGDCAACGQPSCPGCEPDECPDCRSSYCMGDCQECAFPGECCMPEMHARAECFTAEMAEQWHREAEESDG